MPDDTRRLRIGLIGASFGTGNMGVGALAAGAIRCLHDRWPDADIFILDYAIKSSAHQLLLNDVQVRIELLNIRFSKKLYQSNNIAMLIVLASLISLIPSSKICNWILSKNKTLREIYRSNMFASVAGGDSFSDIYGLRRFVYVTLPQILVILVGVKLILLPQTFGPFHSRLSRIVARFITKKADVIYARDHQSAAIVNDLHGKSESSPKPMFRYDVGFALQPTAVAGPFTKSQCVMADGGFVGVNVSGLLYMGGYNKDNMFGIQADYHEFVHSLLDLLIIAKGASVLLIPHVFGDNESSESDVTACNAVYQHCKDRFGHRLNLLQGVYDQGEIKYVIGRCDFFIGSRMHACIAALSQCVPSVCVAYSDKFIGVMETINQPGLVADARKLDKDQLLAWCEQCYEHRNEVRQRLEEFMPEVLEEALHLFSGGERDGRGQPVEAVVAGQAN
jgi:colanic acid/amylovoran biosynthesis protein